MGLPFLDQTISLHCVTGLVFQRLDPCNLRHLYVERMLSKPRIPKERLRKQFELQEKARERERELGECLFARKHGYSSRGNVPVSDFGHTWDTRGTRIGHIT